MRGVCLYKAATVGRANREGRNDSPKRQARPTVAALYLRSRRSYLGCQARYRRGNSAGGLKCMV